MLLQAKFTNFTVIPDATMCFATGINLIVSDNLCGKTDILKALYSVLNVSSSSKLTKDSLQKAYAKKLIGTFRVGSLGRLVKRRRARIRCELATIMIDDKHNSEFNFCSNAINSVHVTKLPSSNIDKKPVFLPTNELISLFPLLVETSDNHHLEFDETWRDTCVLLGTPPARGPKEKYVTEIIDLLEHAMGGKVYREPITGRFYLHKSRRYEVEMPLVSEGVRKMAMLANLITSGVLLNKGCLFWDEPESNLDPKSIKVIAKVIYILALKGAQVFIGTYSLFLLRELELLSRSDLTAVEFRFFGLSQVTDGVIMEQADELEGIENLALLDEELEHLDRYLG